MATQPSVAKPHVVVLGAGPAGLGAAYQLAKSGTAHVTVVEQRQDAGGNAGSFEVDGVAVDYGSHRLHPECAPEVLRDLRALLGDDLLTMPRHGRIRLQGRWLHFPLKPLNLMLHLPPSFTAGAAQDTLLRRKRRSKGGNETFASVMERNLGPTLCRDFYFPYSQKVWGIPPEEISPVQAQKRVSANSPVKIIRRVMGAVPGVASKSSRSFFYPRNGYGQISRRLHEEAARMGVAFLMGTRVMSVERSGNTVTAVNVQTGERAERIQADQVWSTLPMTLLARLLAPAAPDEVLAATKQMSFQGMVLVYLTLETPQFTPYDAHYFPEAHIQISRLSEPKNYARRSQPANRTVLCAEIPCGQDSGLWQMSDEALGKLVVSALETAGLPVRARVLGALSRKITHAYPIYRLGFEQHFTTIDQWLAGMDGLLTFGRQGLFAHDNTHHALDMAYSAVKCLRPDGTFDRGLWGRYRVEFEKNVVVD